MFADWYTDYQRMLFPRSAQEDLSLWASVGDPSLPDYVEGAQDALDHFQVSLSFFHGLFSRRSREVDQKTMDVIDSFGQLKTKIALLRESPSSPSLDLAEQLIRDFEALLQQKADKIWTVFQNETGRALEVGLARWKKFVEKGIQGKQWQGIFPIYWDAVARTFTGYEMEIDEKFLARLPNDPHVFLVWDYWDYQADLGNRDMLSRTIQLAEPYHDLTTYKTTLVALDQRLQEKLVPYEGFLDKKPQPYFLESYFWWYYGVPEGIFILNDAEFDYEQIGEK